MAYIPRRLEDKFLRMSGFFKAVLVTGARQVGKTTMLRHLAEGQNRTYVTLDNLRPIRRPLSSTRSSMRRSCSGRLRFCATRARRPAVSG